MNESESSMLESYNFSIRPENYKNYFLFRYFKSLDRLTSFLSNGIYMPNASEFSDKLECVDRDTIIEINKYKNYQEVWPEHNHHISAEELQEHKELANVKLRILAGKIVNSQKEFYISCWYMPDNQNENELMWKSYGNDSVNNTKGFLVRINLHDFMSHINSIAALNNQLGLLVYGTIKYFDFNRDDIQEVKYAGFRKHVSFKDEREFRLLVHDKKGEIKAPVFLELPKGFYYDIGIYAHPDYSYNEYIGFRSVLNKNYELELHLSELNVWYKLGEELREAK